MGADPSRLGAGRRDRPLLRLIAQQTQASAAGPTDQQHRDPTGPAAGSASLQRTVANVQLVTMSLGCGYPLEIHYPVEFPGLATVGRSHVISGCSELEQESQSPANRERDGVGHRAESCDQTLLGHGLDVLALRVAQIVQP